MANVMIDDVHLSDIADAIRTKKGTSNKMYPRNMASEISGISTGMDTQDATALARDILYGKTAYAKGIRLTGSMTNNGSYGGNIREASRSIGIPEGYHDGNGYVKIDTNETAKLIPENIKNGVTILGVTGNLQAGAGGKQVKTGTTSSPIIYTGLWSIDQLILFAKDIKALGLISAVFDGGSTCTATFCGDYSPYMKACGIKQSNEFAVSSGTFSWNGTEQQATALQAGVTYNWIAIGN